MVKVILILALSTIRLSCSPILVKKENLALKEKHPTSSENGQKRGTETRKDGKVRQVIVRHIGMAKDEEELKHFIRLA